MEYQQKKHHLLQQVQYQNLLSFSLISNKIESNFKTIVDAMLLYQNAQAAIQANIKAHQEQFKQIRQLISHHANPTNNPITINHNTNSITSQNHNKQYQNNMDQFLKKQQHQADIQQIQQQISLLSNNNNDYLDQTLKKLQSQIHTLKAQIHIINQKTSNKSIKRDPTLKDIPNISNQNIPNTHISHHQLSNHIISNKNLTQSQINNKENPIITTNIINHDNSQMEKQMNGIILQLNTLKIGYEELRQLTNDLKRKQSKHTQQIGDLNEHLKKIQRQLYVDNQNIQKQIKNIGIQLATIQNTPHQVIKQEQTNVNVINPTLDTNFKNEINDKFSKLKSMIQAAVSQNEFNKFKNDNKLKMQSIQNNNQNLKQTIQTVEEQAKKLYEIIDQKNSEIQDFKKELQLIKQHLQDKSLQWDRKHNIALSKVDEIKKNIQNLRQDLQFYQSMQTQPTINNQNNQNRNSQNGHEQQPNNQNLKASQMKSIQKQLESFKKSINGKIQDQRIYLLGIIRDIQRKLITKGTQEQQITGIWDKIGQLNLFLGKKADYQDTKKAVGNLQKKFNLMASHLIRSEDNTQDARIAKKNWFCLSCDKNLQEYTGKIGKHIAWEHLPFKGASKVIKDLKDDKKVLPSIKK